MADRSGYEKAVLLELRITRLMVWATSIAILAITAAHILVRFGTPVGVICTDILLGCGGCVAGRREFQSEAKLKEIWLSESLRELAK